MKSLLHLVSAITTLEVKMTLHASQLEEFMRVANILDDYCAGRIDRPAACLALGCDDPDALIESLKNVSSIR